MKAKQEPITIKAALLLRMFKNQVTHECTVSNSPIEVPYCFFSALQKLKMDKAIASLGALNPTIPFLN